MEWNLSNKKLPNYLNFAQNSKKVIGFSIERPSKNNSIALLSIFFLKKEQTQSMEWMKLFIISSRSIERKQYRSLDLIRGPFKREKEETSRESWRVTNILSIISAF